MEDKDDKPLRAVIRQWPDLARQIAVCRCFGVENLPSDKFLEGLIVDGRLKNTALLHRDGDFMTVDESEIWSNRFKTPGVFPWVTAGSDIEAYFCQTDYLCALYGVTSEKAEDWRNRAAKNVNGARKTFLEKRKKVTSLIWPNAGGPNAETMWTEKGGPSPATVKGKQLHAALKPIIKAEKFDNKLLNRFEIPPGYIVAPELKALIEEAIKGSNAQ